jgi:hypothetical protein
MTRYPDFGVLLRRWSDHQRLDIGGLSLLAGITEPEIQTVLDGMAPSPSLLRRLAPALNLHTADLFVIAGVAVPDDLAPLDSKGGGWIPQLVGHAMRLAPERRGQLRQFVRSLPQHDRTAPTPTPPVYEQYPPSFGAVLVRMLANRNLNWSCSAKTLFHLTSLRLAASTIGAVGHGRKALTPDLLVGFATVLGIPADGLAALTGIELPDGTPSQKTTAVGIAELIWDLRRLTADQVRQVRDKAESMR